MIPCLDCGTPTITGVCMPCTDERRHLDGDAWFSQFRSDLWERYPEGDWDGCGAGIRREEVRPTATKRRQSKKEKPGVPLAGTSGSPKE